MQRFFLAGNPNEGERQQQQKGSQQGRTFGRGQKGHSSSEEGSANIFRGFDLDILSEVFNVDQETAEKLQSPDDNRGHIVTVERGLQVIRPPIRIGQQEQQGSANGLEETFCSTKFTSNINDASRADIFNPQAGWTSHLNGIDLPILQMVQLSAERGVLNRVSN